MTKHTPAAEALHSVLDAFDRGYYVVNDKGVEHEALVATIKEALLADDKLFASIVLSLGKARNRLAEGRRVGAFESADAALYEEINTLLQSKGDGQS